MNVLGILELNEARAREENERSEKHTYGLQDLGILTQTHTLGLWIEKEYRKQEVGMEGKPKIMVSDFLVTGWSMLVGEESSVN